jgi:hypothetical protein
VERAKLLLPSSFFLGESDQWPKTRRRVRCKVLRPMFLRLTIPKLKVPQLKEFLRLKVHNDSQLQSCKVPAAHFPTPKFQWMQVPTVAKFLLVRSPLVGKIKNTSKDKEIAIAGLTCSCNVSTLNALFLSKFLKFKVFKSPTAQNSYGSKVPTG